MRMAALSSDRPAAARMAKRSGSARGDPTGRAVAIHSLPARYLTV